MCHLQSEKLRDNSIHIIPKGVEYCIAKHSPVMDTQTPQLVQGCLHPP